MHTVAPTVKALFNWGVGFIVHWCCILMKLPTWETFCLPERKFLFEMPNQDSTETLNRPDRLWWRLLTVRPKGVSKSYSQTEYSPRKSLVEFHDLGSRSLWPTQVCSLGLDHVILWRWRSTIMLSSLCSTMFSYSQARVKVGGKILSVAGH